MFADNEASVIYALLSKLITPAAIFKNPVPAAVAITPDPLFTTTPAADKPESIKPVKVGLFDIPIDCGKDKVTAPVDDDAIT